MLPNILKRISFALLEHELCKKGKKDEVYNEQFKFGIMGLSLLITTGSQFNNK